MWKFKVVLMKKRRNRHFVIIYAGDSNYGARRKTLGLGADKVVYFFDFSPSQWQEDKPRAPIVSGHCLG